MARIRGKPRLPAVSCSQPALPDGALLWSHNGDLPLTHELHSPPSERHACWRGGCRAVRHLGGAPSDESDRPHSLRPVVSELATGLSGCCGGGLRVVRQPVTNGSSEPHFWSGFESNRTVGIRSVGAVSSTRSEEPTPLPNIAVQLTSQNIEEHTRARFSATEMALQNIAELLSFATTIVFPRPEDFRYPVFISFGASTMAAVCFAAYVRKERGHLLHMSRCLDKRTVSAQQILDPR